MKGGTASAAEDGAAALITHANSPRQIGNVL